MFAVLVTLSLYLLCSIHPIDAYPSDAQIQSRSEIGEQGTNTKSYNVKAKQAILVDYETGEILFAKNDTEKMTPSSMSKIMTSYLVFSALKDRSLAMHDRFRVSEKAWKTQGSKMFLSLNSEVMVEDLIRGMIVQSGNDACIVLAEGMFGDEMIFVGHMNNMADELGLTGSHFDNATGLPAPNHYMTARDLAILAVRLLKDFPDYYRYHAEKDFEHNKIAQSNRNTLLGIGGVDGVKTGHTEDGGYGMVISAERNSRRLIGIVNGLNSIKERAEEAGKLLNYGFNNFSLRTLYRNGESVDKINIWYGDKPEVAITVKSPLELYIPRYLAKNDGIEIDLKYQNNITAPIAAGTEVGTMTVKIHNIYGDNIVIPLVTAEEVKKANFVQTILQNIDILISR